MSNTGSVVLHTSWRGRLTTVSAPAILLALGGFGTWKAPGLLPLVLLAVGIVLALVALLDFPLVSVIGADGIQRRCALRSQHLDWARIASVARPAQANRWRRDVTGVAGGRADRAIPGARPAHAEHESSRAAKGGLIAEIGRRPFLLCDKLESRAEYDAIRSGLREWAPGLPLRASRPDESVPPTWLHKKRRGSASDGLVDLLA